MKNILCFGDSNTYGLNPEWVIGNFGRHDRTVRWTGRLQTLLGSDYYVIEEGLNGRTTVFDNPTCPDRVGVTYLSPCIASHTPLDLIIIMLGTNDCNGMHGACPAEIGFGLGRLLKIAKDPSLYLGSKPPKVLVAVPVPIGEAALKSPDGITTPEMVEKSKALAGVYAGVAKMYGCGYIDLGLVAEASELDGVHLMPEAHAAIADAMAEKVREMIG